MVVLPAPVEPTKAIFCPGLAYMPSLMELKDVFEILSQNEIGILQAVDKSLSPENNVYVLSDAKKTVNRLRAIASSIETGLL